MLRALIWIYRYFVSPLIGPQCRFAPTCSEYADQAIAIHGVAHGSNLALRRIARCHPWGDLGYDPVPPAGRANRASR
ncbi:MAG: membrane protein insertion efficiency factor YidD [Proteobacteria bacterium]|nr:membrane protein insertion efficiency factor YidD [Pseudomonadota bacterium]